MSPQQQQEVDTLVERWKDIETQAKLLANEAFEAGDQETAWMMRACLADLQRTVDELEKEVGEETLTGHLPDSEKSEMRIS